VSACVCWRLAAVSVSVLRLLSFVASLQQPTVRCWSFRFVFAFVFASLSLSLSLSLLLPFSFVLSLPLPLTAAMSIADAVASWLPIWAPGHHLHTCHTVLMRWCQADIEREAPGHDSADFHHKPNPQPYVQFTELSGRPPQCNYATRPWRPASPQPDLISALPAVRAGSRAQGTWRG